MEATYEIENLTVTNGATLTIAGGSTVNVAGATTITGSGRILLQGKNTSGQVEGQWLGVGVTINSTDVQVDAGSAISADAQGYLGGFGPGSGGSDAALHGGSGGGATTAAAGRGGGAITLNVTDTLTLDGMISANGSEGGSVTCSLAAAGGGSGGSIFITTSTLTGTGSVTAHGGAGGEGGCTGGGDDGGGGGGGRIAVHYIVDDGFAGVTTSSVNVGAGGPGRSGAPGTLLSSAVWATATAMNGSRSTSWCAWSTSRSARSTSARAWPATVIATERLS